MIKRTLQELCLNITDGKHGDCENEENSGYYFISCKDIFDGQINYKNARQITKADFEETHKRTMLEVDDILLTNSGTIGRMAFVTDREATTKTTFQKSVAIIKPDKQKVLPRYLYYQLQNCVPQFINSSNGSAQKNLLLSTMRTFQIEIEENREKQEKIANTLSAYDDLIENNRKQIKLLEEAAQRLYKEWFVDLHFPGHENTKIVDGLPEGWSKSTVFEVSAILRRGISPKYNENARGIVINQKCIRQTIVSYDEARAQEKKYPAELELKEADIAICSTGAGTLGRVGQIYEVRENTTLDSHVTLIRANEKIGQQYLFWSLKMQQDYLMSAGKGSTNQLELSRETIGNCKILMPEQKIAEQAEKNFVAIHNKMKECSMQIARLREARDLLLPKLMSGEVEM
mgnify:FL=1